MSIRALQGLLRETFDEPAAPAQWVCAEQRTHCHAPGTHEKVADAILRAILGRSFRSCELKDLHPPVFGFRMPVMGLLNKIASLALLLAFTASTTHLGLLVKGWRQSQPISRTSLCSLHAADCCCPEVCNRFRKSEAKKTCHASRADAKQAAPVSAPSTATCFLKAGCGGSDLLTDLFSASKNFLPEARMPLAFEMEVSFLHDPDQFTPSQGYFPTPFQPPRNS